jgi:hypothetical protein
MMAGFRVMVDIADDAFRARMHVAGNAGKLPH